MSNWIRVCPTEAIEEDDLIRFDHGEGTYVVYRTRKGFFATDGLCTHEAQHLEEGVVIGMVIECPLHQGRFNIASGEAVGGPVCEALKTYPVKIEDDVLYIQLPHDTS